jgi:toxin-antitoxin system PIN domain toxin
VSATVDVNVLLYASDESSGFHVKAADVLERLSRGPDLLYLFWPVLLGYLRMATHAAIFPQPLSVGNATANVGQLLALPHARAVGESVDFWHAYSRVTADMVVRGNFVSDAHLVALMLENGVSTIWSHDRDLRKFEGVRVRDPFA